MTSFMKIISSPCATRMSNAWANFIPGIYAKRYSYTDIHFCLPVGSFSTQYTHTHTRPHVFPVDVCERCDRDQGIFGGECVCVCIWRFCIFRQWKCDIVCWRRLLFIQPNRGDEACDLPLSLSLFPSACVFYSFVWFGAPAYRLYPADAADFTRTFDSHVKKKLPRRNEKYTLVFYCWICVYVRQIPRYTSTTSTSLLALLSMP